MKIEYHGRWLRFRLELFPKREPSERLRYEPPRKAPVMRRRLMRRIEAHLRPPLTAT
jgi:hypothetical protein